jgi:hypothetical protein
VIEQVAVVPAVYGAYGIEEPGVDLELFAAAEAGDKAVYYILLLGGELVGVGKSVSRRGYTVPSISMVPF